MQPRPLGSGPLQPLPGERAGAERLVQLPLVDLDGAVAVAHEGLLAHQGLGLGQRVGAHHHDPDEGAVLLGQGGREPLLLRGLAPGPQGGTAVPDGAGEQDAAGLLLAVVPRQVLVQHGLGLGARLVVAVQGEKQHRGSLLQTVLQYALDDLLVLDQRNHPHRPPALRALERVARRLYRGAFFGGNLSDETRQLAKTNLGKGVRTVMQLAKFSPWVAGVDAFGEHAGKVDAYVKTASERPSVKNVNDARKAFMDARKKK